MLPVQLAFGERAGHVSWHGGGRMRVLEGIPRASHARPPLARRSPARRSNATVTSA
ncbi:hypothetical protein OAO87_03830 [bacterium]|nr:hypothetical protein [bacterium]